jgi:hypothetical protein
MGSNVPYQKNKKKQFKNIKKRKNQKQIKKSLESTIRAGGKWF